MRRLGLAIACLWFQSGCAGAAPQGAAAADAELPVELALVSAEGEPLRLSDYRGQPLLLFLFATYDSPSQLAFTPLVDALSDYEKLRVVGVALQPDPSDFLAIFRASLGLEFPLGYDPQGLLLAGETPLGRLPGIPEYVLLDARGRVLSRHQGVLMHDALRAFLDRTH